MFCCTNLINILWCKLNLLPHVAFEHFCLFHIDISHPSPSPSPLSNADQDSSNSAVQSPRLVRTNLAKQRRVFLHNLCLLSGPCCSYIFSNCFENIDLCFFSLQPRLNPFNRASLVVVEQPDSNSDLSVSREPDSSETGLGWNSKPSYSSTSHFEAKIISEPDHIFFSLRAHDSIEKPPRRRIQSHFRGIHHIWNLLSRVEAGAQKEDVSVKTRIHCVGKQRQRLRHSGSVGDRRPCPETEHPARVQCELRPVQHRWNASSSVSACTANKYSIWKLPAALQ